MEKYTIYDYTTNSPEWIDVEPPSKYDRERHENPDEYVFLTIPANNTGTSDNLVLKKSELYALVDYLKENE